MDCLSTLEDLKMTCEKLLKKLKTKSASKKNKAMIEEVRELLLTINLRILREKYCDELREVLQKSIAEMNEEG